MTYDRVTGYVCLFWNGGIEMQGLLPSARILMMCI
jgi:hypothetical protein